MWDCFYNSRIFTSGHQRGDNTAATRWQPVLDLRRIRRRPWIEARVQRDLERARLAAEKKALREAERRAQEAAGGPPIGVDDLTRASFDVAGLRALAPNARDLDVLQARWER